MSEILNNLVIKPITATIVVGTTPINITPTATQLNIYGGVAQPAAATSLNATISNVHISGGTNGYVLQTDGTGILNWTAQTGGGGGTGTPGGANTQIQFNDAGVFGAAAGFTFDKVSNVLVAPGNINAANVNATFYGSGIGLTSIPGAHIVGEVANASYSLGSSTSGTVTTTAQPNITSVGILNSLIIAGNLTVNNAANIAGTSFLAGNITTSGYQGNITGANVISSLTLKTINLNILSNTNPNTATSGNTAATFKYPITINGNLYYLNLTEYI
jgi:hypothetical protein